MVEEVSLVCSNYLSYLQVMLMLEKQKHLDCQSFPYLQSDFSNESLALICICVAYSADWIKA